MQSRNVDNPDLRWDAVSRWVRAWDPFLDSRDLESWAEGLMAAAVDVDSGVLWSPEADVVAAPANRSAAELETCMRLALASFAGIGSTRRDESTNSDDEGPNPDR
ncbi:hypothetical protein M2280_000984 [Prescottella agglutinans]|uniref:Uncharacterized protein n=1 Tax=Prescottella agglutinans TaxID=1644129 RepID=A0ABT6M681_9NOCA|nr:hypothetical protein [Prescottella agglutinans]